MFIYSLEPVIIQFILTLISFAAFSAPVASAVLWPAALRNTFDFLFLLPLAIAKGVEFSKFALAETGNSPGPAGLVWFHKAHCQRPPQ